MPPPIPYVALLVLALASLAGTCLGQPIEPVAARAAWRSASVQDGRVWLPLVPAEGAQHPRLASRTLWAPSPLRVRAIDDDAPREARLRRLVPRSPRPPSEPGEGASWSERAPMWIEAPPDEPARSPSIWLLEIDVRATDRALRVGGRRVTLFERPARHRARAQLPDDPISRRSIEPIARDPERAWHAGWLGVPPDITDPLALAWADAIGARWDEAMRRLLEADPIVARRVERRLVALGAPGSSVLPIWEPHDEIERELLVELLRDGTDPDALVLASASWLARGAPLVVWVQDDAPVLRAGALPSVSLGLLSRSARPVSVAIESEPGPARLRPSLEPGALGQTVHLPVDTRRPSSRITIDAGTWRSALQSVSRPLTVAPPALRIGALYSDHTRATLGTDAIPPPRHDPTSASLQRLEPGMWQLVVRCNTPEGRVICWLGPRDSVSPIVLEPQVPEIVGAGLRGWSLVEDDRWLAVVEFSEQAFVDRDGVLRLALVRHDGAGRRATWPRPMVPGQSEPGRLALDLSAWSTGD